MERFFKFREWLCLLCLALSVPAAAETYNYDEAGRLTQVTYDNGSSITYTYDKNGNILSTVKSTPPANIPPDGSIDTPGAGGGGLCFIATAVYGSYDAPQAVTLRHFLDRVLARTGIGRAFIGWYYDHSPFRAAWAEDKSWVRLSGRVVLTPLVVVAAAAAEGDPNACLLTVIFLSVGIWPVWLGRGER